MEYKKVKVQQTVPIKRDSREVEESSIRLIIKQCIEGYIPVFSTLRFMKTENKDKTINVRTYTMSEKSVDIEEMSSGRVYKIGTSEWKKVERLVERVEGIDELLEIITKERRTGATSDSDIKRLIARVEKGKKKPLTTLLEVSKNLNTILSFIVLYKKKPIHKAAILGSEGWRLINS